MSNEPSKVEVKKLKGKQTTIYIGDSKFSGIDITINKKNRSFYVSGWYDSFVGIEGGEILLDDFIKLFEKG